MRRYNGGWDLATGGTAVFLTSWPRVPFQVVRGPLPVSVFSCPVQGEHTLVGTAGDLPRPIAVPKQVPGLWLE
jgi:hypothetical protein